jgi:predicted DsbA family dithiol-disulfide isomerase
MTITVTDYLDVVSSWCFWSEPTWVELKRRYDGRVQFQWKIALMDPTGLPTSREQVLSTQRDDDAFGVYAQY